MVKSFIAVVLCAVVLAGLVSGCNKLTNKAGITITVTRPADLAVEQIAISVFDNGREVIHDTWPKTPGGTLQTTEKIHVVLDNPEEGARVTVVARALHEDDEVDSSSDVVALHKGKFSQALIDLENGRLCEAVEGCVGFDRDCNDVIETGCCAEGTWQYETAVNFPSISAGSIALFNDEEPYVTFHGTGDFSYAYRPPNGVWKQGDFLGELGFNDGFKPKIDFDSEGNAHIMALTDDYGNARHEVNHYYTTTPSAHSTPGGQWFSAKWASWDPEPVPAITALSFEINRDNDTMHVIYNGNAAGTRSLISISSAANTVVSGIGTPLTSNTLLIPVYGSLALDSNGKPHVLSSGIYAFEVGLANYAKETSQWTIGRDTIQVGHNSYTEEISAAVRSDHSAVGVYYAYLEEGPPSEEFTYVEFADNDVDVTTEHPLPADSGRGHNPSLAMDPFGVSHVIFQSDSESDHDLEYGCRTDEGVWTFEPLRSSAVTESDRAIRLGADGCVHVAYTIVNASDDPVRIEYAKRCPN